MMKRYSILGLIIAFVVSISAIGCSNGGGSGPTPQPKTATAAPTTEPPTPTSTPTATPTLTPTPTATSTTPAPTPTPTVGRLLQVSGPDPLGMGPLERPIWGRGYGSISIGGYTSGSTFLFIEGKATNVGDESLYSVICVMKCWSGDTLVKTEEYIVGTVIEEIGFIQYYTILPENSFEFDIRTPDDPTIDNVTVEFKDSSGFEIPSTN